MKRVCFLFYLFLFKTITACECPPLEPITQNLCSNYNVIFYGKVDSVTASAEQGNGIAYFTINELYKGNVQQQIKINFDASSSCMMSFAANEEWIIYATYVKFDYLKTSICSHSRKHFNDTENDFYFAASHKTFDEEKIFLKTTLHLQPFTEQNEFNIQQQQFKPHNIQPEPINKMWLVLISFASIGIVLLITRKKNKNGK